MKPGLSNILLLLGSNQNITTDIKLHKIVEYGILIWKFSVVIFGTTQQQFVNCEIRYPIFSMWRMWSVWSVLYINTNPPSREWLECKWRILQVFKQYFGNLVTFIYHGLYLDDSWLFDFIEFWINFLNLRPRGRCIGMEMIIAPSCMEIFI